MESLSLGRKEGSRRATCVYIAVSGTSNPPCPALFGLFDSGHPLSSTKQEANDVSQSIPGSLSQEKLFQTLKLQFAVFKKKKKKLPQKTYTSFMDY